MYQDMEEQGKKVRGPDGGHLGVEKSLGPCSGLNNDPKHTQGLNPGTCRCSLTGNRALQMG